MRAAGYLLCSGCCALVLCASAAPALGLEPGVHADPGSPAEKEYVLPLEQARGTGAEHSSHSKSQSSSHSKSQSSSHSSSPHLFGAGITPPRGGASGGGGSQPPSGKASGTSGAGRAGASGQAGRASGARGGTTAGGQLPAAVLRASRSQGSSADGSLLVLIGGGLAILVVGAFGGTVLRRSRRPAPGGGRPTPSG